MAGGAGIGRLRPRDVPARHAARDAGAGLDPRPPRRRSSSRSADPRRHRSRQSSSLAASLVGLPPELSQIPQMDLPHPAQRWRQAGLDLEEVCAESRDVPRTTSACAGRAARAQLWITTGSVPS